MLLTFGELLINSRALIVSYEGELNKGLFNGVGELVYRNGVTYRGIFLSGHKMGRGYLSYGGTKYACHFHEDQLQGELTLI